MPRIWGSSSLTRLAGTTLDLVSDVMIDAGIVDVTDGGNVQVNCTITAATGS